MSSQLSRLQGSARLLTEQFILTPLTPAEVRRLAESLLRDHGLALQVPWVEEKTGEGAVREALLLELECTMGTAIGWGLIERESDALVGVALVRQTDVGSNMDLLCASPFADQKADEVEAPIVEWLQAHTGLCRVE